MVMKTMKHTYRAWTASLMILAMAMFSSCEQETFGVTFQDAEPNTLTLKLLCNGDEGSRSEDNDNMYNEDKIDRLDIFLYLKDAGLDAPAKVRKTIENVNARSSKEVTFSLTTEQVGYLFPNGATECGIYVIANRPDNLSWDEEKMYTVGELKALTVTANFAYFNENKEYQQQANFVMDSDFNVGEDGFDKVSLNTATHALEGTVLLFRAASKISLKITDVTPVAVTNEDGEQLYVTSEGEVVTTAEGNTSLVWNADIDAMKVRLNYGVNKTTIGNIEPYTIVKADYFSFGSGYDVTLNPTPIDGGESGAPWTHSPAFYSYPMDWSENANTQSEEPYLTLNVPWERSDKKQKYESTYYQIPISTITKKLERNTHYQINLVVSRLGSLVEETPTVIYPSSYIIVPWQNVNVNADLMDYRYLMVEEKDITIYNENELYIPYVTSHEAEIVDITCEQMDLSLQIPDWEDASYDDLNLTQKKGFIYFKNELDNNYKSNTFDFSPYRITFTIRHKDEEGKEKYLERVTITQYPAIYGKAEMNSDWTTTGTDNEKHDNGGYLFVNGHNDDISATPTPNNATVFCSTPGMGGDDVLNWASPNMYVFTVSSVEGTDYVIGDPRDATYTYDGTDKKWNSTDNVVWAEGPVLHNGIVYSSNSNNVVAPRTIMYYYGTEKSDRTINMIAPKFRIASGYAVLQTGQNDSRFLEALKMRCASYQEDGYPAGRWRLPTKAEFEFIITQTNKGRLPDIYKDGYTYWCAHGPGTISGTNVTVDENVTSVTGNRVNGYSARCVYDEWYWTDKLETEAQKNVFTWGDQPR